MGRETSTLTQKVLIGVVIILLATSGLLGVMNARLHSEVQDATLYRTERTSYPLLSTRIFVDNPNDMILNLAPLRSELRDYFADLNTQYSFYAEYLPTGTSIKINQDSPMIAASLLKVPVVMNLFYAAEKDKVNLSDTATMQKSDIDKKSGNLWQKGVGSKFTLKELARHAIIDSDNTAINMLLRVASNKFDIFQKTIEELDIDLISTDTSQTMIGAQAYSSMLKCLYLSCVNTYKDSQQILEWMSDSISPPRLRAVLPTTLRVAHKYGTSGGASESDCGIVYVPKRPYIICVMVASDSDTANTIIQEVSKKVYEYISNYK